MPFIGFFNTEAQRITERTEAIFGSRYGLWLSWIVRLP
jgi:hypothetical protein